MQVLFHNRRGVTGLGFPARQVSLPELLASSDIVVLAVPGGAETGHLIGADQLAAMQPHAILINIARGDVVDEAALIAALDAGQIAGAGLDVYEREPLVPDTLRARDDVVLLPDEPYVFTASDGPEAFASVPTQLVSGRLITWYGPAMLEAATLWMNQPGSRAGRPY